MNIWEPQDNLNYWGQTPEEDEAERRQRQIQIEQESSELEALGFFDPNNQEVTVDDREATAYGIYPNDNTGYFLTGQEFVDTHESIDDHPRAMAFGQFLGWTGDANLSQNLAFGDETALEQIRDPDIRERASSIFDRLGEMNYWEQFDE